MRIGIATSTTENFNIWSNGIAQNTMFLALLLQRIRFVQSVVLVDTGGVGGLGPQVDLKGLGLRLVPLARSGDEVDVFIEVSGALPLSFCDLQRARGKKVVSCSVGQPYANLLDMTIFDRQGHFQRPDRYDRIWLLPKDRVHVTMMRTIYRCPVDIAPYIWSPIFLRERLKEIKKAGASFGVSAGSSAGAPSHPWRVAIFEPNMSPIKMGLVPMLIADTVARKHPDAISAMMVLNAQHLVNHATLLQFANSLDLVRNHRATFLGRHDTAGFLADQQVDAVISHQWGNDQNYFYLDVLYGGYPLVHNSSWLKDAGYFYPGNEISIGAYRLCDALANHQKNIDAYKQSVDVVMRSVAIDGDDNIKKYADLLLWVVQ